MSKIKFYIDNVRGAADSSKDLYYHYVLDDGTNERKYGWRSYNSFTDEEDDYRAPFWEAIVYWYEYNHSIEFKIDKSRGDSFYHYAEYIDGYRIATGWGLYSKLHTDKERDAWLKGVSDYASSSNISTPLADIKRNISDIKNAFALQETTFPEEKSLLMPSIVSLFQEVVDAIKGEDISDDFIDKVLASMHGSMPTVKELIHHALTAAQFNLTVKFEKLLHSMQSLGVTVLLNPFLDAINKVIDEYLSKINLLYNEVARECNKAIRAYRKIVEYSKLDGDDAKKLVDTYKSQFNEELKKYSKEFQELLGELLFLDSLTSITKNLKHIHTSTQETWRNIIADAKTVTKMDFSETGSVILPALKKLFLVMLPLLGALVGALLGFDCSNRQEPKVALSGAKRTLDDLGGKASNDSYEDLNDYIFENEDGDIDLNVDKLEDSIIEEYVEPTPAGVERLLQVAIVYRKAYYLRHRYSLYPCMGSGSSSANSSSSSNSDDNTQQQDPSNCKLSMCDTSDDTNLEDLNKNSVVGSNYIPIRLIVEFGQDLYPNARLLAYEDQIIQVDDIIGYIEDIPVKSKVSCRVLKVKPTYFIAEYWYGSDDLYESENEDDFTNHIEEFYQEQVDKFGTGMYDELIDLYSRSAWVDIFIKDYLSYYRYPELALFTRDFSYDKTYHNTVYTNSFLNELKYSYGKSVASGTEISSDEFIEKYEDSANKIRDDYHDKVKKACSKKNIKELSKNNQISTLKSLLDSYKKEFVDKILTLYKDNPGKMKFCSKGRIVDFMLCDNWIEYLHGDDFVYDDDNPYVRELSNAISRFIGIRTKLELNANNIANLIKKFNQFCDSTLKPYWAAYTSNYKYMNNYNNSYEYIQNFDYYSQFNELFKFEYYLNTPSIDEGSAEDKDSISLYKRIYNYLKTVVGLETTEPATMEITEETDVAALLDSYDKMTANTDDSYKLDRKLRQIAHRFISLRKIENSMNDNNITTTISTSSLNEYSNIDDAITREYNGTIEEVDEASTDYYKYVTFITNEKVLNDYLQNLKTITANEVMTLQEIGANAVQWYRENSTKIYDNTLFEQFLEIPWPNKMNVYHGCCIRRPKWMSDEDWEEYRKVPCYKYDYFLFTDIDADDYRNHTGISIPKGEQTEDGYISPSIGNSIIPPKTLDEITQIEKLIDLDAAAEETDEDLSTSCHVKSSSDITKIKYWLRYCGIATLVNAMMPIYWATGLVIAGAPVLLPIIYIPLVVIPGRIVTVIGIGLCGVIPMPMVLFANPSSTPGTIIIPLNIVVDVLIKELEKLSHNKLNGIKGLLNPMILALDKEIQKTETDLQDLEYQLGEVKTTIIDTPKTEYSVEHTLDIEQGVDTTTKRKDEDEITTSYAQENLYKPYDDSAAVAANIAVIEIPPAPIEYCTTGVDISSSNNRDAEQTADQIYNGNIMTLRDLRSPMPDDKYKSYENVIVFIDPGHEYESTHTKDGKLTMKGSPYALNDISPALALEEYQWVRTVSGMIKEILLLRARNITVYYTTDNNLNKQTTTHLSARKRYAANIMNKPENKNKHAVFLSIHANAAGRGGKWYNSGGGWSVFVSTNDSLQTKSSPFASSLRAAADRILGKDHIWQSYREVQDAQSAGTGMNDLGVLSAENLDDAQRRAWAKIPAALTENMFQDVVSDVTFMTANPDIIASVNAEGILDYLDTKTNWVINNTMYST